MSDLAIIDPSAALEAATDPAEFVVACLTRGKSWLTEALEHGDLEAIANVKGWAVTLRTATMQKQLGKDAEIAATELVRRAERAIGLGIRAGQEAGEVRGRATNGLATARNQHGVFGGRDPDQTAPTTSPKTIITSGQELHEVYAMTDDVTDEQFEQAIEGAKDEGNLSRANVVRHVKGKPTTDKVKVARDLAGSGNTTAQIAIHLGYSREGMREFLKRHHIDVPADAVVGRQRSFDSTRIVSSTCDSVNGIGMLFDHIVYADLDHEDVKSWLPVLDEAIRSLTTLRTRLKKVSQP